MEYISFEFFKEIKSRSSVLFLNRFLSDEWLSVIWSFCLSVCVSICLSNSSCDIPICMAQAAVTLCLVCICLQNLFKSFYGLLSKKRHRLNQLLLNSQ